MGKTPKRVWAIMHQNFVSKVHVKIFMQNFDAFFERVWAPLGPLIILILGLSHGLVG